MVWKIDVKHDKFDYHLGDSRGGDTEAMILAIAP